MTNQRRRILWQQLLSLPKLICEKIIVRLPSDGIHTVSNSSKEDLIKFGIKDSSKITMIPNGIDIDCAAFNTTQCRYHNFALFIGRLVEYKNLGVAITAFGKVVEAMPDAGLVIVGDGPARHDLERSVISHHLSRNVEFTGYVSEEQKSLLLKNCSMLVFPSLIEGFGLVILEAFANRKPVLASDVKPLREIIKDGSDGFLVPPSESAKWADRILFCLKNKDICQSMGENGRRKAETNYNICKVAEDVESMYVKIIAARRRTDGAESIQKEGHGIATGIN